MTEEVGMTDIHPKILRSLDFRQEREGDAKKRAHGYISTCA